MEKCFGTGRATGNEYVYGNKVFGSANDGIVVVLEGATANSAGSHGKHILGARHLFPQHLQGGGHATGNGSRNNEQVCLTGRCSEHFGTETCNIIAGHGTAHHFDGAAAGAVSQGPNGIGAGPVDHIVNRIHDVLAAGNGVQNLRSKVDYSHLRSPFFQA